MTPKQFSDRQDMSGYDILNIENPHFQTIRKVIHKDDLQSNKAYQDALVKQDCQACLDMPDEVFTDDFYKGYADDSGGDDEDKIPDEPLRPEVQKLKDELDL